MDYWFKCVGLWKKQPGLKHWLRFLQSVLALSWNNIIVVLILEIFCFYDEQVDDELEIKAYYAGHVLGAAMFHMRVGTESLVYTVSIINT